MGLLGAGLLYWHTICLCGNKTIIGAAWLTPIFGLGAQTRSYQILPFWGPVRRGAKEIGRKNGAEGYVRGLSLT